MWLLKYYNDFSVILLENPRNELVPLLSSKTRRVLLEAMYRCSPEICIQIWEARKALLRKILALSNIVSPIQQLSRISRDPEGQFQTFGKRILHYQEEAISLPTYCRTGQEKLILFYIPKYFKNLIEFFSCLETTYRET